MNSMISAETGARGFMLSARAEFLAPYGESVGELPRKIEVLRQTITEEPGEKPRLEKLNRPRRKRKTRLAYSNRKLLK